MRRLAAVLATAALALTALPAGAAQEGDRRICAGYRPLDVYCIYLPF